MFVQHSGKSSTGILQIMKSEIMRISHELQAQKEKIKENTEKIKVNKTLPYLVSNVIEVSMSVVKLLFHCCKYKVCMLSQSSRKEGVLRIIQFQRCFFLFLNEYICCDPSLELSR